MSNKEKISILFIDEVPQIAGSAHSFMALISGLDRNKYEAYLKNPAGPLSQLASDKGVKTFNWKCRVRYKSIPLGFFEIPLNPWPLLWRLADAIKLISLTRKYNIKLIHTNNLDGHMVGWFLSKITGIPVICHIRTYWPKAMYKIPWPDRIIFVSKAVKDASIGINNNNKHGLVVYNGIKMSDFEFQPSARSEVGREFNIPEDTPIIGIVGRLTPWKNHVLFIKAAAEVSKRGFNAIWMIVGSEIENRGGSNHEKDLVKLTKELGLEKSVIFTDFRSNISMMVSSFDMFISSSTNDPNPRSVLEAMSIGIPVIGTLSGGLPEMLDDGKAGLLVEPDNVQEMADAICKLLSDQDYAKKLGSIGHQRVKDIYTTKVHARNVEEVYADILNKNNS